MIYFMAAFVLLTGVLLLFAYDRPSIFFWNHFDLFRNVHLVLVLGFVLLYGTVSMLALFFNLPVSSEMEQKESRYRSSSWNIDSGKHYLIVTTFVGYESTGKAFEEKNEMIVR